MKKRVITGVVYIIVMICLLALKFLVPPTNSGVAFGAVGIDLLCTLISIVGAYEFTRAVGEHKEKGDGGISKLQRWCTIVICGMITPFFAVAKMLTTKLVYGGADLSGDPLGVPALITLLTVTALGALVTAVMTVFDPDHSDLKSTAYAELCILYCGVLVSVIANINHMVENTSIAILLLFVLVPCVDTFAFLFGSAFGKIFPTKLAPKTSPNKTVIGGIGGVIGGVVAAIAVWAIAEFAAPGAVAQFPNMPVLKYDGVLPKWLLLVIIAVPTSILAQLGDLFESALKRGCGIKDMGKLLPGHGGVLDRFDSMLFASVSVVVSFMII